MSSDLLSGTWFSRTNGTCLGRFRIKICPSNTYRMSRIPLSHLLLSANFSFSQSWSSKASMRDAASAGGFECVICNTSVPLSTRWRDRRELSLNGGEPILNFLSNSRRLMSTLLTFGDCSPTTVFPLLEQRERRVLHRRSTQEKGSTPFTR